MRIAHVITGLKTGGAEIMLLKLAEAMRPDLESQAIFSLSDAGIVGPILQQRGFDVEIMGMRGCADLPRTVKKLAGRLRAFRPDIVQTWLYHADLVGGLATRLGGKGCLVWGIRHSDLSREANKRSTLWVVRACSVLSRLLPDGILCNSTRAMEIHAAFGYERSCMRFLPNGFDLDLFKRDDTAGKAWRNSLSIPKDALVVGWAGRNHPQKGPDAFLQLARRISRMRDNVYFVMAGEGIERSHPGFQEALRQAGNPPVLSVGPCQDMPTFMSALDIFASTSIGEGFSNALAEAMCCETVCVATDVGDSAKVLGDCGRVTAPGDLGGLSDAIESVLDMGPGERIALGSRARARIRSNWSIESVARDYLNYYRGLLVSDIHVR